MKHRLRPANDVSSKRVDDDWGSLAWLTDGESVPGLTVGRVVIRKGRQNPEHFHTTCDEILYLLSGRLRHTVGDDSVIVEPGDVLQLPRDTHHRALSIGDEDADMLVIYNSSDRDFHPSDLMEDLVASPVCYPDDDLDTVMRRFAAMGFTLFEAFTTWVGSRLDVTVSPERYLQTARRHGMAFRSVHLPKIDGSDPATVARALDAIDFAAALGAPIALYKAASIDDYIAYARQALDRAEEQGVTLVIQNHANTALAYPDDVAAVLDGVADERLKVLLEVGHYEKVEVPWQQPFERFADRIAYCHIKDLADGESVAFGDGSFDFGALLSRMNELEYGNGYVVELEAKGALAEQSSMDAALARSVDHLLDVAKAGDS